MYIMLQSSAEKLRHVLKETQEQHEKELNHTHSMWHSCY